MMLADPEQAQRLRFEKMKRLTSHSEYGEALHLQA